MAKKKRIGFDLDGVLYPWHEVVFDLCLEFKYIDESMTEEKFWKEWFTHEARPIFVDNILGDMSLFFKKKMSPDNVSLLNRLKKRFDIFFISQRADCAYLVTKGWLKDVNLFDNNLYLVEDKPAMVRVLDIDYFLEDRVENVDKLKHVVNTFIVSAPFNMDYYDKDVTRLGYTVDLEEYL